MLLNRFRHSAHFQNAQKHVTWLYFFLVFMSVFGVWLIFEMHRGMWPGYTFSRFHECFWHLAHFGNTQRHAAQIYFFSFSRAFFCICWFQIVFGILPIFKTHGSMRSGRPVIFFLVFMSVFGILLIFEMNGGMSSGHIFSRFHERFWYFAYFRNAQMHVVRSYFFSFSCATSKKFQNKFQKCCPTKI